MGTSRGEQSGAGAFNRRCGSRPITSTASTAGCRCCSNGSTDEKVPEREIDKAGYGAIWHGQPRWNGVAILARGCTPEETRRGLPGDPGDSQSRYLEAAIGGRLVGCLYLPNGNPRPGPKFDYKLDWIDRFIALAEERRGLDAPVILAGDYTVIPTDADVYKPERWLDDALFAPEAKERYARLGR